MTYTFISEHDNENKKTDVFLLERIDPKTGETKLYGKFEVPDDAFTKRIMVDTNRRLNCYKLGTELFCREDPYPKFLPKLCYINKEGEKYCNFDLIHKYPGYFVTMSEDIAELYKLRPRLIGWLIDNDVEVSVSDALPKGIAGTASCYGDMRKIQYKFQPTKQDTIRVLSHEIAHCKEHVARAKKGLPPPKGEWRKEGEKLTPVGSEERAVHFERRMLKRWQ